MTKEERIDKAKENIEILKRIESNLTEDLERAKEQTHNAMIYLFKLENGFEIDDLVFIDGWKAIVSGFAITNGTIKLKVKKFKRDKTTGRYIDLNYSNDTVVQPKNKIDKL